MSKNPGPCWGFLLDRLKWEDLLEESSKDVKTLETLWESPCSVRSSRIPKKELTWLESSMMTCRRHSAAEKVLGIPTDNFKLSKTEDFYIVRLDDNKMLLKNHPHFCGWLFSQGAVLCGLVLRVCRILLVGNGKGSSWSTVVRMSTRALTHSITNHHKSIWNQQNYLVTAIKPFQFLWQMRPCVKWRKGSAFLVPCFFSNRFFVLVKRLGHLLPSGVPLARHWSIWRPRQWPQGHWERKLGRNLSCLQLLAVSRLKRFPIHNLALTRRSARCQCWKLVCNTSHQKDRSLAVEPNPVFPSLSYAQDCLKIPALIVPLLSMTAVAYNSYNKGIPLFLDNTCAICLCNVGISKARILSCGHAPKPHSFAADFFLSVVMDVVGMVVRYVTIYCYLVLVDVMSSRGFSLHLHRRLAGSWWPLSDMPRGVGLSNVWASQGNGPGLERVRKLIWPLLFNTFHICSYS